MGRLSEYSKEEQDIINGGTVAVPVHELQEIDRVLVRAMDALESDADLEARRQAFEMIQDLYWPPKIMSKVSREGE